MKIHFRSSGTTPVNITVNGNCYFFGNDGNDLLTVDIENDSADVRVMYDMRNDIAEFNELINESIGEETKIHKKLIMKTGAKVLKNLADTVLVADCRYKLCGLTDGEITDITADDVPIANGITDENVFIMIYPKLTTQKASSTLTDVQPVNSREVISCYKKINLSGVFIRWFAVLVQYPFRMLRIKHLCRPKTMKKNILNAEKLKRKAEKRSKHPVLKTLAVVLAFLIFIIFIEPVVFVKYDKPALVAADYSQVTIEKDVYTRIDALPADADYPELILGVKNAQHIDARLDGLSKFDQSLCDMEVYKLTDSAGNEYIWLKTEATDNIDKQLEDYKDPYVYIKAE